MCSLCSVQTARRKPVGCANQSTSGSTKRLLWQSAETNSVKMNPWMSSPCHRENIGISPELLTANGTLHFCTTSEKKTVHKNSWHNIYEYCKTPYFLRQIIIFTATKNINNITDYWSISVNNLYSYISWHCTVAMMYLLTSKTYMIQ